MCDSSLPPPAGCSRFEARLWLPGSLAEVYAFLSDPRNLDRLTPDWMRFHILRPTPPIDLQAGTKIDYRLRWRGVPLAWTSHVIELDPPGRLTYEQARGPYRVFRHVHCFEEVDGGTLVVDLVDYAGPLGRWLDRLFVARDLEAIFAYRAGELERRWPVGAPER